MSLEQGVLVDIVYLSESKKELTTRRIIPTFVPRQTIKSIDVSDLSPEDRASMLALYDEYTKYYEAFLDNAFNFETWAEHAKGIHISPKWRAFRLANIKQVL
jgi:hypothetical protein